MLKYRTQPILNANTLEVTALEILAKNPKQLNYLDAKAMALHDLQSIDYALEIYEENLKMHVNIEWGTILLAGEEMTKRIIPGIIIELVERYDALLETSKKQQYTILKVIEAIRKRGGWIAMDDIDPSEITGALIMEICPEIIKVDNRDALSSLRSTHNVTKFIAERIESEDQAELARLLGADEIQGFWCDSICEPIECGRRTGGRALDQI
jgi:c-di-GMP-related signal transduction protein